MFGVHRYPLLSDRLSVWLMTSQVISQVTKETRKLSTVTKRLQVLFFYFFILFCLLSRIYNLLIWIVLPISVVLLLL